MQKICGLCTDIFYNFSDFIGTSKFIMHIHYVDFIVSIFVTTINLIIKNINIIKFIINKKTQAKSVKLFFFAIV